MLAAGNVLGIISLDFKQVLDTFPHASLISNFKYCGLYRITIRQIHN